MRSTDIVSRSLNKPAGLWIAFAAILLIVAIGLGMLSRHALRLQWQQVATQQRERIQQSVRIALWRLDSRLAPYIATLHQNQRRPTSSTDEGQFIQSRFLISRGSDSSGDRARYQLDELPSESGMVGPIDREAQLQNEALIRAIEDLVPAQKIGTVVQPDQPAVEQPVAQSKSQQYSNTFRQSISGNQRKRQSRADVVQQQVEFNSLPQVAPNQSLDPFEFDLQMVSLWVGNRLAVVRSNVEGQQGFEGVWVDWPGLHRSLVADIDDVLPGATIRPVGKDETVDPEFALAALPAKIVPGKNDVIADSWSPTHTALLLSWAAFAVSAMIAGIALGRLIALSERRAAFVSAVTHELRTPLTTFRLYSDLLAREMVTDPEDRRSYLETLRREADRLTHLVDNVLRYSRLEGTLQPAEPEVVMVSQWIERVTPRLRSRLDEAGMVLDVDQSGDGKWQTDPQAMEQVLFNLIDNAAKYACGAKDNRVHLQVHVQAADITLVVADHGQGVPDSLHHSMFQPFAKSAQRAADTASGVGLGLALVRRTVAALGGTVSYRESPAGGAEFRVVVSRV
jgi:signal transduction histidine kinase